MSRYIRIEWADSQEWLEKVDDEKIFAGQDNDVFVREDLLNDVISPNEAYKIGYTDGEMHTKKKLNEKISKKAEGTKTIYRVEIQDGERSYTEYSRFKPEDDGFETEVKDVEEYEATEEEIKVLEKFGVI